MKPFKFFALLCSRSLFSFQRMNINEVQQKHQITKLKKTQVVPNKILIRFSSYKIIGKIHVYKKKQLTSHKIYIVTTVLPK